MKGLLSYIPLFLAFIFALGGIPAYQYLYDVTQNTTTSVILTVVYEMIVIVVSFLAKVWERLEGKWADRAADWVDLSLQTVFSGYRKRYLEYMVYQHRVFDVKGLSTQGPYNLELEKVYVELSVDPTPTHEIKSNPIQKLPETLRSGSHTIWEYINDKNVKGNNFAVLGAPGSGKTTLLKHMALTLAAPNHQRSKQGAPNLLPILLFLRDHQKSIKENPNIPLAQLIRDQFADRQAPIPPAGWVEAPPEQSLLNYWFNDKSFSWINPISINAHEINPAFDRELEIAANSIGWDINSNLENALACAFDFSHTRSLIDPHTTADVLHPVVNRHPSVARNLAHALDVSRQTLLRIIGSILSSSAIWLSIRKRLNATSEDKNFDFCLYQYINIFILIERIEGRLPAFEGIRIGKERIMS